MTTKDITKTLSELRSMNETIIDDHLVDSLQEIEHSYFNMKGFLTNVRVKKIMSTFEQSSTDIYVQTIPKAGTTLVQMILYQMTTDGNMDFQHLYDVSPWYTVPARGSSKTFRNFLQNPPKYSGRKIIKSHLQYSMFKDLKKGKLVYVLRDVRDQILSSYHQQVNYFGYKGEFKNYVDGNMEYWFKENKVWLRNEYSLPIIYLNYEDIISDKRAVIIKLADFLDIPISENVIDRVIERTSFSFMKKHEKKFGERPVANDERKFNQFIRKGKVGKGKDQFTKEQIEKYQKLSLDFFGTHEITKRYFESL